MHNIPSGQFETPVKSIIPMPVLTGVGVLPDVSDFNAVRAKEDARVALHSNDGNPLYADWEYGIGKVGSFMVTLDTSWDGQGYLVPGTEGARFILNVVRDLMASKPPSVAGVTAEFNVSTALSAEAEDFVRYNYTSLIRLKGTQAMNLITGDDVIKAIVTAPSRRTQEITFIANGVNTVEALFDSREAGVYTIDINKYDSSGRIVEGFEIREYWAFSYSREYDAFASSAQARPLMEDIARRSKDATGFGGLVFNASDVFGDGVDSIVHDRDPRLIFLIIAVCLFLLDIAVRKFKFKWPWELVRASKEKKALQAKKAAESIQVA